MRSTSIRSRSVLVAVVALAGASVVAVASPAAAENATVSTEARRTGWDRNEVGLLPAIVGGPNFARQYATQLDGQINAQPVVARGTVLAVTEKDKAYGVDPASGRITWSRDVGPAWPTSTVGCDDGLTPTVGISSTPVYDSESDTAFFTAKVDDGPDADHPHWYLHAIDITSGAERPNFPVTIGGRASNDPGRTFDARTASQRPGLLLLDGVVYAAFGSHCDAGAYTGWVAGVDRTTGTQTALWSTEVGAGTKGGIGQSGSGLVSDGPGRIFLTTGNGTAPGPSAGTSPPGTLAQSVVRLQVGSDGSLSAKDFFSPVANGDKLGSGGSMAVPNGFGTSAHPRLLVQAGEDGRVFLLDRDKLGGKGQGTGNTDAALQVGPAGKGVYGHPAFWGGDGGYVYTVTKDGPLTAYKTGTASNGLPALTKVGSSTDDFGYTSGSPVVTGTGSANGTGLVWVVHAPDETGAGAELRAYDAVPTGGQLTLRFSAPVGTSAAFAEPASEAGRVVVGNREGVLTSFGQPTTQELTGPRYGDPSQPWTGTQGLGAQATYLYTARSTVTVYGISTEAPWRVGTPAGVTFPKTLTRGGTLDIPIYYNPTVADGQRSSLNIATNLGNVSQPIFSAASGPDPTGTPGIRSKPARVTLPPVRAGSSITRDVLVQSVSEGVVTIDDSTGPSAPFSATLPDDGTELRQGESVAVPVTFSPTTAGTFTSSLVVDTNTSGPPLTIPISATALPAGDPELTLSRTSVNLGSVAVGASASGTFALRSTGDAPVRLNAPGLPDAPFAVGNPVRAGQRIAPDDSIAQTVTFTPTATGSFSSTYTIEGDDGQGEQTVTVTGTGTAAAPSNVVPAPAAGGWTYNGKASQLGATTRLTDLSTYAGSVVYPTPVATSGLRARFTARISGGRGGDGLTFALLNPSSTSSTSLGRVGGALGFAPLAGAAVALDTYKNGTDPSANFVGIAKGGAKGTGASETLDYVATAAGPPNLRDSAHDVDVTVTATGLSVSIDGGAPLTATVPVPSTARLAFTAANGGYVNLHEVDNVVITKGASANPA